MQTTIITALFLAMIAFIWLAPAAVVVPVMGYALIAFLAFVAAVVVYSAYFFITN